MTDAIPETGYTPDRVTRDSERLAERLRQIAESLRMDFDMPSVSATLGEAADALLPPAPSTVGTVEAGLNALALKLNRAVEIRTDYDSGYADCLQDTLEDLNVIRNLTPATTRDVGAEAQPSRNQIEADTLYEVANLMEQKVMNVREFGDRGFPYRNGADHVVRLLRALDVPLRAASAKGDGK